MIVTILQLFLSIISGLIVGFILGLIGGGGSIMAIPLLLYFVGIGNVHYAIGTTALAVGVTAYINAISHYRRSKVDIRTGVIFSVIGVIGVLIGSSIGLLTGSNSLLVLFSILMMAIGVFMYVGRGRYKSSPPKEESYANNTKTKKGKLGIFSVLTGFSSGFFGIGGGFLIVPALIYSTGMEIDQAVGTSLLVVGTFGILTALRYGFSGSLLYSVSLFYIIGGVIGGVIGARISVGLPKDTLRKVFSVIVVVVGIYVLLRTIL